MEDKFQDGLATRKPVGKFLNSPNRREEPKWGNKATGDKEWEDSIDVFEAQSVQLDQLDVVGETTRCLWEESQLDLTLIFCVTVRNDAARTEPIKKDQSKV